jgi:hypothetical protein
VFYMEMNPHHQPAPRRESHLAALAHRVGAEVPHLLIALTTVAAGIATLIAF